MGRHAVATVWRLPPSPIALCTQSSVATTQPASPDAVEYLAEEPVDNEAMATGVLVPMGSHHNEGVLACVVTPTHKLWSEPDNEVQAQLISAKLALDATRLFARVMDDLGLARSLGPQLLPVCEKGNSGELIVKRAFAPADVGRIVKRAFAPADIVELCYICEWNGFHTHSTLRCGMCRRPICAWHVIQWGLCWPCWNDLQ